MHFNLPSSLFAFLGFEPWMIAVVIPVAAMIFAGAMITVAMYFHNRRQEMWHQTARLALEKGQSLPDLPADSLSWRALTAQQTAPARGRGYLIGGLINIAIGVGLYIALSQVSKPAAYFAAIPFFIGVAHLVATVIEAMFSRKSDN